MEEFGLAYFSASGRLITSSGGHPTVELARTEAANAFRQQIEPRATMIRIFRGRDATEENFIEDVPRPGR